MKKLLKNKNILFALLGVITGVLLLIFGSINDTSSHTVSPQTSFSSEELESYTTSLEKKVSDHISKINGVSDVSVILTIDGSNEKVYATNGSGKDYVITKDSTGNENALILTEINATVRGIAVVCDYGQDQTLRQQIIEMLSSLFNIGANRISVMPA
jgi:stage III sporulation protein AG